AQAIKGFLWMFTGTGIQSIMQFIVLIVLARLLDAEAFGVISAAFVVIGLGRILARIGIGPALVQKKDLKSIHIDTGFTFSIFLSLCLGAVMYFSSGLIASFFDISQLHRVLELLSLMLVLDGVTKVSESLIQRDLLFHLLVRIQVIS